VIGRDVKQRVVLEVLPNRCTSTSVEYIGTSDQQYNKRECKEV
jgi:hypothetical protein